MATTLYKFAIVNEAVGRWVYKHGSPSTIGLVIEADLTSATVRWVRGTGTWVNLELMTGLMDFQSLIDDHQKKLNTHKELLKNSKTTMMFVRDVSDVGK